MAVVPLYEFSDFSYTIYPFRHGGFASFEFLLGYYGKLNSLPWTPECFLNTFRTLPFCPYAQPRIPLQKRSNLFSQPNVIHLRER